MTESFSPTGRLVVLLAPFCHLSIVAFVAKMKRKDLDLDDVDEETDQCTESVVDLKGPFLSESKQDVQLVRGARACVMIVLLLAGLVVSVLTYVLLTLGEDTTFKSQVCAYRLREREFDGSLQSWPP
jgi:hypothetical protein